METLHKLAGVTEASNANEPPAIPQDADTEHQSDGHLSPRASRVSLPLNRQPSHKSFRSSKGVSRSASRASRSNRPSPNLTPQDHPPLPLADGQRASQRSDVSSEREEEFPWNSNHPCFPHPNPHCAPNSEEYQKTRVIRVKRDWLHSGDLYPHYANLYPEILDPLVTDDDFRFLISNLNARLKSAFDPFSARAWVDCVMAVATGFIWDDLGLTGSKQGVKGLEAFIDKWNAQKEQEAKEVRVVHLRRTGFMALDFVVPDPGIDTIEDDEEERVDGGIGPAE